MPIGINSSIKWSMLELSGLLEDGDAHVHFQRSKRHLALHPFQLNDLNKALREILSSKVNFYDSDLQGLVLAYKNPKLLDALGGILHDSHFIHVDIEADFYIFRPKVGCTLKGIANKKAGNHLGVLVHKAFNVSILKADDCQEWLGDYVFVGQEVKFTVTHLDFKGKLPFIRGELIPDVTMGQVYYDSMNNEELEEKPTQLLVDGENSEISEERSKRSKKSRSVDDNGEQASDTFSRTNENNVERVKNGKNDALDSESSSDDRDRIKSPGSSMRKLMEVRARRKLDSKKASRSKRSSTDTSEEKKLQNREKRGDETDSSVEEKPKVFGTEESIVSKRKRIDSKSMSQELDSPDRRNETDRVTGHGELDDVVTSPMKRSKKNRISDSDEDDVSEIDVKPDIRVKKKKKKKDDEEEEEEKKEEDEGEKKKNKEKYKVKKEDEEEKKKKTKKKSKEKENEVKQEDEEERKKSKKKSKEKGNESEENAVKKEDEEERKKSKKKFKEKENEVKNEEEEEKKKSKKKSKEKEKDEEDTVEEGKKKKIKKKYKAEEDVVSDAQPDVIEFEFIKPDLDAFEIPTAKCKRKRRKTITDDDEASVIPVDDSSGEDNEFFRDVRVKVEPEPSDIENSRPRKKDRKRKKRHSASENGDEDVKKREGLFGEVGIKQEPDMSDVEESRPKKKKSKRKTCEGDFFEDVKVKIEPDASDIEESSTLKPSFKREPEESSKSRDESTTKGV